MSHDSQKWPQVTPAESARLARVASRTLAKLSNESRNEVLTAVAEALEHSRQRILEANEQDCRSAGPAVAAGKMTSAMFERLRMDQHGINEMAMRVRDVVRLPDPLGRQISATELDDGLVLYKESCPLGVIGIVFESRPDVISQVAALALKSGNAVLLKGGAEAANTNETLFEIWGHTLAGFLGIPKDFMHLLYTRSDVLELLSLNREIDLIIPRGSRAFVEFVAQNSRIPVLGQGEGICHVFIDRMADLETALRVTLDSKVQYPAACNAAETLLVHESIAGEFLPLLVSKLKEAGVEVRGCAKTLAMLVGPGIVPATERDWSTEYSDLVLSVKIVASAVEAIEHIHRYGSGHTEAVVTKDRDTAKTFMDEIDAAGVYHNVSTRFADGFRYGLGAELGVSTNKLHARGPVGLEGLTTYKYRLFGNGHIVAEYASGTRHFKHRPLTGSGHQ
jgi:glutamate-5-semialdehyde dehydrogenase